MKSVTNKKNKDLATDSSLASIKTDKLDQANKEDNFIVDNQVLVLIPQDIARKHHMVAIEKNGNVVTVGMIDTQNIDALNILGFIAKRSHLEFKPQLISEKIFQDLIDQYSGGAEKAIEEAMETLAGDEYEQDNILSSSDDQDDDKNKETVQAAPVTKLLSVVIRHAIEGKASDIHIEPFNKEYRVRFRVDGVLHASLSIPKEVGRAIVSRIKILANLKIDEKRKPQDGRFRITEDGHSVDFRVSTLPVLDAEKVVMRLLDQGSKRIDLEQMGVVGRGSEILMRNIREPFGVILMTGPTGSGKSTTLYACLEILNEEERNIITLEDPVEYSISGINQSQINPEIGYTFASGLRSILRQDPNVIMVGEIRDSETAELTIHAALTGHLVLSTLHTNSSIGAVPRLIDMGIESFLISSSLRVVAAQRLVRRICDDCREEIELHPTIGRQINDELANVSIEEMQKYGVDLNKGVHMYKGAGCDKCNNTGYKGRVAIFEALEITNDLKAIIAESKGSEAEIEKYARKSGMITIKQDGFLKIILGLTTLEEIERVTEGSGGIGGAEEDDKG